MALGPYDAPGAAEVSSGSQARGRGATCGIAHRSKTGDRGRSVRRWEIGATCGVADCSKTGEYGRSVRCRVIDWNDACGALPGSWTGEPGGGASPS